MDSIFTQILDGRIPAHWIYQDDFCGAFLDIHPIQPGHTLVVPRSPSTSFLDMHSRDFGRLMETCHMIAKELQQKLGCKRIVVRIEGFDVAHTHVHLVPVNNENESYKAGRLNAEPDHNALRTLASKLKIN